MQSNFAHYPQQGLIPQFPGIQSIGSMPSNADPFAHAGGYATQGNPFAQTQFSANPQPNNQPNNVIHPAQLVPVLGQLAQQLAFQSASTHQIAQQLGVLLQQLAYQLTAPNLQNPYYAQSPYPAVPGGYGGFAPPLQPWGSTRAQTIQ